jgi:hypothetical protein
MKQTLKRLVFGFFSSALLAVGLARAANLLDPVSQSVIATETVASGDSIAGTSTECDVIQDIC